MGPQSKSSCKLISLLTRPGDYHFPVQLREKRSPKADNLVLGLHLGKAPSIVVDPCVRTSTDHPHPPYTHPQMHCGNTCAPPSPSVPFQLRTLTPPAFRIPTISTLTHSQQGAKFLGICVSGLSDDLRIHVQYVLEEFKQCRFICFAFLHIPTWAKGLRDEI